MPKFDKSEKGKLRLTTDQLNQIAGGRIAIIDPNDRYYKFRCWADEEDPAHVQELLNGGLIAIDAEDSNDPRLNN